MRSPPDNHRELSEFECTPYTELPLVDLGVATSFLAFGGVATAVSVSNNRNLAPALGILGIGIVMAAAGIYGYGVADRCLDAQNELLYRKELETQRQLSALSR